MRTLGHVSEHTTRGRPFSRKNGRDARKLCGKCAERFRKGKNKQGKPRRGCGKTKFRVSCLGGSQLTPKMRQKWLLYSCEVQDGPDSFFQKSSLSVEVYAHKTRESNSSHVAGTSRCERERERERAHTPSFDGGRGKLGGREDTKNRLPGKIENSADILSARTYDAKVGGRRSATQAPNLT